VGLRHADRSVVTHAEIYIFVGRHRPRLGQRLVKPMPQAGIASGGLAARVLRWLCRHHWRPQQAAKPMPQAGIVLGERAVTS
jgi:hypothetical protein